jgi:hypothetical protein
MISCWEVDPVPFVFFGQDIGPCRLSVALDRALFPLVSRSSFTLQTLSSSHLALNQLYPIISLRSSPYSYFNIFYTSAMQIFRSMMSVALSLPTSRRGLGELSSSLGLCRHLCEVWSRIGEGGEFICWGVTRNGQKNCG